MNTQIEEISTTTDTDLEPSIAAMLERKRRATAHTGDYSPVGLTAVHLGLPRFFERTGDVMTVRWVKPLGGGASNEQYVVEVEQHDGERKRVVLRIDAVQGVMETDRQREFDVLRFLEPHFPVPHAEWVEPTGDILGRPFLATSFVEGVTAPTQASDQSVSGMQTKLSGALREALADQFVSNLVKLHGIPLDAVALGDLRIPDGDTKQAARWQVNWWSNVWRDDAVVPFPLIVGIESWLRHHLPDRDHLAIVHGDYRTGNYLFDESSHRITAVLDWELAHVGDPHEDLAWGIQRLYSTVEEDRRLVTGLMTRDELLDKYQQLSGRTIDRHTLHFYEVLCAFKSLVATLGSSVRAARDRQSHQDVLLTWLASCGYLFAADIIDMIEKGPR